MMEPPHNHYKYLVSGIIIFIITWLIGFFLVRIAYGQDRPMKKDEHLEIIKQLKVEEGFRDKPYKDTVGAWTIAYGHNLSGRKLTLNEHERLFPDMRYPSTLAQQITYLRSRPISEEKATYLLEQDIKIAEGDAVKIYGFLWDAMPVEKKVPILDMIFNLGSYRYNKFHRHIAAVKKGDWNEAAKQVENSLAYQQDRNRYKRITAEIRGK